MGLDFITADPATDAFRQGTQFEDQQREKREKRGVDAAVRAGVTDMLAPQQPSTPAAVPGTLNSIDAAPSVAPAPSAQPSTPPPPNVAPSAPPGVPPTPSGLAGGISSVESGGRANVVNRQGYSGKYQFGSAALNAAGVYQPAQGENLNGNEWRGMINLPGRAPMTHQQFLSDPDAQDHAWNMHVSNLDAEGQRRGMNRWMGQNVAGVPISYDSLRALMQIGGPAGTQKFLESGGQYNPADANGTTMSAYALKVMGKIRGGDGGAGLAGALGGQSDQAGTITPADANAAASSVSLGLGGSAPVGGQPAAAVGGVGSRYDAILARLAGTPGGGATALTLMGQQVKQDTATANRQTQYQRLAMQALGRGDTDVFKYYSQLGGLNVPPAILQNAGMTKRLATVSLLAERFYKDDPAAAQKLTAAYLQSGDIQQAFQVAGPPASNPRLTVQWLRSGEQEVAMSFNPRTGTMAPVVDQTGQQASRDVRPTADAKPMWVTQPNGTSVLHRMENGQMVPVPGPDGEPMVQAAKPATGGRVADRVVRLQMLRAAGLDDQTANMIAGGASPSANTIANVNAKMRADFNKNAILTGDTPEQIEGKVEGTMTRMFGPGWQTALQGRVAPGAIAPATIGPNAAPPLPMAPRDTGSAPPGPGAAASPPSAASGPAMAIGDSIAVGIQQATGAQGPATTGIGPQAVLANIRALPPAQVQGRSITLSSGASNNPGQLAQVEQQIAELKARGATSIRLVGVGEGRFPGVNAQLAAIAQRTGATFLGPLQTGPDGVHPTDYRGFGAAGGQAPAATPQGQPVRPASVPRGSVYSPSRRQYRDPAGNLYDETGAPIQAVAQ